MDEAENCDRIAIMDAGKVVVLDTPDRLEGEHRHRPRADHDRRRRGGDRRAARRGWGSTAEMHDGMVTFGVPDGAGVRAPAVRRARRADPLGAGRPAVARRRVHVVHRAGRSATPRRAHRPQPRLRRRVQEMTDDDEHDHRDRRPASDRARPRSVRVVDAGLRQDLRAVKVVWHRELLRFGQDRIRIVALLVQPMLFLFVLGTGLSSLTERLDGRRRPADVHVPRRPRDVGAVHGDVLGRVGGVGPRVRVPARDARRARSAAARSSSARRSAGRPWRRCRAC